jgi:hypothetical protein
MEFLQKDILNDGDFTEKKINLNDAFLYKNNLNEGVFTTNKL